VLYLGFIQLLERNELFLMPLDAVRVFLLGSDVEFFVHYSLMVAFALSACDVFFCFLILQGYGAEVLASLLKTDLLGQHVLHPDALLFLPSVLLQSVLLFNLLLMAITGVEQLASFLSRDISQFLSPLLLESESSNSVLKGLVLPDLIMEQHRLVMHLHTGQDSW